MAALQKDADRHISNNEREFILKALQEGQRIDGRAPFESRPLRLQFSLDDSSCTVQLGRTRVLAVVSASLDAPFADRHSEGSLRFNVEFSPMASPAFEAGRPGEDAIEVARLIERGLRESRAVDLEALVVLAGRKVWHLRVDVHVLDHGGNLAGACGLASLAALMAFRRPDATLGGDDGQTVTVHPPELREPVPLSLHHLPLPICFAVFGEEGELLAVDPSLKEEAAAAGTFTVTQNAFGELCALQKVDGFGLTPSQILNCIRLAAQQVVDLTGQIKKALEAHAVARVQARVRRQPGAAAAAGLAGPARGVTVLRADQLLPQAASSPGAAAAGCDGQGGPAALAWDALPDSVRAALQQAEQGGEDEDESMGGDSSADSSSVEEEEAGEEAEEEQGEPQDDAKQNQQGASPAAVQNGPDGQQPATAPGQQGAAQAPKKRRSAPASREEQRDELATIAAMIANAGGGSGPPDLAAAVMKKQKGKEKARR